MPEPEAQSRVVPLNLPVHLNCPHCHNPIEIVGDGHEEEVICPSCGSSFRLDPDHTQSWSKDKLPTLGKFELIEAVGRGAFGTVYRARDTQLQRIVAVKVPRSGRLATDEDEDRFVREARNAAQLQHCGIVPVYEVGRSDMFPFIVSEFVEGITLSDALTARRLGFQESAQVVGRIAAALQHAHAQGVVHRDLKPSNIMLTPDGSPRVMDFGLAKRDAGEITMTVDGQVLGTPAYMSPEQAAGQAHHVDGRSDVYSLGGILYELLTGELPFRGNQRMILHQVLHDEPRTPRSLNDRIPRDLETICLTAIAKEPARRYPTAQAMADDLERFISGKPIVARPVGRAERGWRWCRRNPMVASLLATVMLLLLAGSGISTMFAIDAAAQTREAVAEKTRADVKAREAAVERQMAIESQQLETRQRAQAEEAARRAEIEARKAEQVARFLARMFEESAPLEFGGLRFGLSKRALASANLTAREILDRGAERVTNELQDQPVVQAALKDTMGNVYLGLGNTEKAEVLLEQAFELRQRHLPREHLDTASSLHSIGILRFAQFRMAESAAALREALAIRRQLLGDDHELVDTSRMALAAVVAVNINNTGGAANPDVLEAIKLWRESLAWRRKHFGNSRRETAGAMLGLAWALTNLIEDDNEVVSFTLSSVESIALMAEAMPILLNDPTTRSIALLMSELSKVLVYRQLGRRDAMLAAIRSTVAAAKEAVDDGHLLMTATSIMACVMALECKQFDEADSLLQTLIQGSPHAHEAYNCLAWLRASCPDARYRNGQEAIEYATKACQLTEWKDWTHLSGLGAAYAEHGDFQEAIRWQTKALEMTPTEKFKQQGRKRLELYKAGLPYRI